MIKEIILQLNCEESISIKILQHFVKDPNLEANLIYIKSNFEIIPGMIKMSESNDYYLLSKSMIKNKNEKTILRK